MVEACFPITALEVRLDNMCFHLLRILYEDPENKRDVLTEIHKVEEATHTHILSVVWFRLNRFWDPQYSYFVIDLVGWEDAYYYNANNGYGRFTKQDFRFWCGDVDVPKEIIQTSSDSPNTVSMIIKLLALGVGGLEKDEIQLVYER